jgi:hypothetical protein
MSEENTRELSDNRPFEQRIFARFDTMERRFDARFDAVDGRFDGLEVRVQALESKALDTKPIWELALAEIVEVKERVLEVKESIYDIKRKFEIVTEDLLQIRADQRRVEKRMDAVESRPQ